MKMMMFHKYVRRVSAVAMCSAVLSTMPMLAQNSGGRIMSPAQQQAQLNALTNAVGLTPDQATQVQAINAEAARLHRTVHDNWRTLAGR